MASQPRRTDCAGGANLAGPARNGFSGLRGHTGASGLAAGESFSAPASHIRTLFMWIRTEPIGSVLRPPALLAVIDAPTGEVAAVVATIGSRVAGASELGLPG